MKTKIFTIFFVLVSFFTYAQMDTIDLTGVNSGTNFYFCASSTDSIVVHKPDGAEISIFYSPHIGDIEIDSIIIYPEWSGIWEWMSSNQTIYFYIYFQSVVPVQPWDQAEVYKCTENSVQLNAQDVHQEDFTYLWSTGATTRIINVNNPGQYSVTITGVCGEASDTITVINYPIPNLDLGEDMENICNWDHQTLDPGEFEAYNWSTGENTQQITVSQTAEYSVTVTDANGCKNSDDVYVHFYENPGIEISTVSVDTVNGNNKIVWNTNIPDFYNNDVDIYRNGTTNELTKIATVPYMQGYFTDEENSSQRTWRYAITAKDNCENHSNISLYHESMKISLVGLIGNAVKVEWTPYTIEGDQTKSISSYKVFSVGGFGESWIASEIATIPGTQTSYNLPLTNDSLYVVGAIINEGSKSSPIMALSIIENPVVTGLESIENIGFEAYPNPSNDGLIKIQGNGNIEIINSLGQTVLYDTVVENKTINLKNGVYYVKFTNENTIYTKKIIVQ